MADKTNKSDQLRRLSADELEARLRHLREEMFNLHFRNSVQQLDNPLAIRSLRRDVARVVTILNEHKKGLRPLTGGGE